MVLHMSEAQKIVWHTETAKVADLKLWDQNPRTITKEAYNRLKARITKRGFHDIIKVTQDMVILSGNQRRRALEELGIETVDIRVPDRELTLEEMQEVALESNRSDGEWDWDQLANFDPELLKGVGFEDKELAKNFQIEVREDEAPAPRPDPGVKLGDLFQLGRHRLLCGDSTVEADVVRLMGSDTPNLRVTDPPYGVDYDPEWREGHDLGVGKRSRGRVKNDNQIDWSPAFRIFKGNVAYVWHAGKYASQVQIGIESAGFDIVSQIIWAKQHFVISRGDYHWQHEPCWYAVRHGSSHAWQGLRDQATVWEINNNNSFGNSKKEQTWGHGTQKPVECMARPIKNNSPEQGGVYDPFGGSGTTLIACEQLNRKCYMMEIDPQYVRVVIDRWEEFTGQKAEKLA